LGLTDVVGQPSRCRHKRRHPSHASAKAFFKLDHATWSSPYSLPGRAFCLHEENPEGSMGQV
jgi:hypothetical protein